MFTLFKFNKGLLPSNPGVHNFWSVWIAFPLSYSCNFCTGYGSFEVKSIFENYIIFTIFVRLNIRLTQKTEYSSKLNGSDNDAYRSSVQIEQGMSKSKIQC